MTEPDICLEHCLDSLILIIALDIQFLQISSPSPPLTIHFRQNFDHFLPDPTSSPSTGCHKCMVPNLD